MGQAVCPPFVQGAWQHCWHWYRSTQPPACTATCDDADDSELDARLAALRRGKGATPDGEGSKAKRRETTTSKPEGVLSLLLPFSLLLPAHYCRCCRHRLVSPPLHPASCCLTTVLLRTTGHTPAAAAAAAAAPKRTYDYTNEAVHWEGGPAAGDLAFNIALGATLVALPLTVGAIARSAFVRYKFTDKRVSVVTKAPWESE